MQKSGDSIETGKKGRGRPRAFDRAAALAQATRLFWQKGYAATSISDLTEAMGIGSPSLYAAFGSKEALYAEALRHYAESYDGLVWARFRNAETARAAVRAFLFDSAAALTGSVADNPLGCMVTLSAVGSEGYQHLGETVREARSVTLERLESRLARAVEEGELAPSADLRALARFVQAVQSGMSILARDGADRAELEAVADTAMRGWDASTGG
ncbi:TetR/AcrR family transcriptional regulator [Sphingosinicella sp. BN140058]|uniref:TetR/AcrR family transcriptional regulator n=1 Tax=Sphingosinicella sp. BN140058 TaxID=1892855 RepID=UPI0010117343|nr:TetR/AcrR family transcriptional regulator [Sphingosinicella sp. BN140058]QAY76497.1 TetR/AcrR family transcriptional regulator [Sphingosinicella sp. BN140058]